MHYLPVLTMSNPLFYYPCYHIKRSDIELYIATLQPACCHTKCSDIELYIINC